MELIAIAVVGLLALWLFLGHHDPNTPPEGYAPVAPNPDAQPEQRTVHAVRYWDEDGDPVPADAPCTASRPCVATSPRYDVDSCVVQRRQDARPLLPADQGIRVEWPVRKRQQVRR